MPPKSAPNKASSSGTSSTSANTKASANKKKRAVTEEEVIEDIPPTTTAASNKGKKARKQATEEEDIEPPVTKGKKGAAGGSAAAAAPKVVPKAAKVPKTPKTLREKILHILATEEKLISLAKLKKRLAESYEVEESTTNNNKINKLLKTLQDEDGHEDYFGKVGGSYHGGIGSPSYEAWKQEDDVRKAQEAEDELHKDDIKCPFCDEWNDTESSFKSEDSIARGGRYVCDHCGKTFWSWISDGYKYGHKVEYKRSGYYLAN